MESVVCFSGQRVFDIVAHSGVMMSTFPLVSHYCHG